MDKPNTDQMLVAVYLSHTAQELARQVTMESVQAASTIPSDVPGATPGKMSLVIIATTVGNIVARTLRVSSEAGVEVTGLFQDMLTDLVNTALANEKLPVRIAFVKPEVLAAVSVEKDGMRRE